MIERELCGGILGAFFECYNELGFGFLESVYRKALATELRIRGHEVDEELPISVQFKGTFVGHFRLDLLVERRVAVELKSASLLGPTDKRQLMNYLRATDLDVGLLLHFGPQPEFHRLVSPRVLARRSSGIRPFSLRSDASVPDASEQEP